MQASNRSLLACLLAYLLHVHEVANDVVLYAAVQHEDLGRLAFPEHFDGLGGDGGHQVDLVGVGKRQGLVLVVDPAQDRARFPNDLQVEGKRRGRKDCRWYSEKERSCLPKTLYLTNHVS